ncbi:hypothetical protein [Sphingorhabdus contaminans]|jgi:hypothetical protein|uniref:DUF2383 domain-containing protein n=1 Tax=Sphingorhabdus contaminans TaxID=1343899 RepID=A0A553WK67_9SPHN|nr:hypothetical protein [Sphingorhabdus contaminans]TSB05044.1 hypothetical protein FOM92_06575 [Sphingorhabdus contaminans]
MEMIERIARVLAGQYLSRDTSGRAGAEHASIWVDGNWTEFKDDAVAVLKTMRQPPTSVTNDNDAALWELVIQSTLEQHGSAAGDGDDFRKPATRDPILSDRREQGIAQTGEEDPLSGIEDPIVAAAVSELSHKSPAEPLIRNNGTDTMNDNAPANPATGVATSNYDSGFAPVGSSDGHQSTEHMVTEIYRLRSLAAALADSVEVCEKVAREGEEIFRSVFLDKAKERREMVNEFNARILALGGKIDGESDYIPDFTLSHLESPAASGTMMNALETHEANLRALFLTAIHEQSGDAEAFLSTQYLVIQRAEEELRRLRAEVAPQ